MIVQAARLGSTKVIEYLLAMHTDLLQDRDRAYACWEGAVSNVSSDKAIVTCLLLTGMMSTARIDETTRHWIGNTLAKKTMRSRSCSPLVLDFVSRVCWIPDRDDKLEATRTGSVEMLTRVHYLGSPWRADGSECVKSCNLSCLKFAVENGAAWNVDVQARCLKRVLTFGIEVTVTHDPQLVVFILETGSDSAERLLSEVRERISGCDNLCEHVLMAFTCRTEKDTGNESQALDIVRILHERYNVPLPERILSLPLDAACGYALDHGIRCTDATCLALIEYDASWSDWYDYIDADHEEELAYASAFIQRLPLFARRGYVEVACRSEMLLLAVRRGLVRCATQLESLCENAADDLYPEDLIMSVFASSTKPLSYVCIIITWLSTRRLLLRRLPFLASPCLKGLRESCLTRMREHVRVFLVPLSDRQKIAREEACDCCTRSKKRPSMTIGSCTVSNR
jgi:hypothetical protein